MYYLSIDWSLQRSVSIIYITNKGYDNNNSKWDKKIKNILKIRTYRNTCMSETPRQKYSKIANYENNPNSKSLKSNLSNTWRHRWELPVLRYHIIRVNSSYPFLGIFFWVILHDFIRQNYHKNQSNRYPFFLIMGNYPISL